MKIGDFSAADAASVAMVAVTCKNRKIETKRNNF